MQKLSSSKSFLLCLSMGVLLAAVGNALKLAGYSWSFFSMSHYSSVAATWVFFLSFTFCMIISHDGKNYGKLYLCSGLLALLLALISVKSFYSLDDFSKIALLMLYFAGYTMFCLLQSYHQADYKKPRYEELFANSWNNIIIIFSACLFLVLVLLMVYLCSGLFFVIAVQFVSRIIDNPHFWPTLVPVSMCSGFYLSYKWDKIIYSTRMILLEFMKILLSPLSAMGWVFFIVALYKVCLVSDLSIIERGWVAFICFNYGVISLIFINAVYQDGKTVKTLSIFYKRVITSLVVLMSLMSLFSLYILFTYNNKNISTADYIALLVITLLLLSYALAYVYSIFQKSESWFSGLRRANFALAWVVIIVALFLNASFIVRTPAKNNASYIIQPHVYSPPAPVDNRLSNLAGNYRQSCYDCSLNNATLHCICNNRKIKPQPTNFARAGNCSYISNIDGKLTCTGKMDNINRIQDFDAAREGVVNNTLKLAALSWQGAGHSESAFVLGYNRSGALHACRDNNNPHLLGIEENGVCSSLDDNKIIISRNYKLLVGGNAHLSWTGGFSSSNARGTTVAVYNPKLKTLSRVCRVIYNNNIVAGVSTQTNSQSLWDYSACKFVFNGKIITSRDYNVLGVKP